MLLRTVLQGPRKLLIWLFTELSQPVVRPMTTNCEESTPVWGNWHQSHLGCYLSDLSAIFLSQWRVSQLRVIQFAMTKQPRKYCKS